MSATSLAESQTVLMSIHLCRDVDDLLEFLHSLCTFATHTFHAHSAGCFVAVEFARGIRDAMSLTLFDPNAVGILRPQRSRGQFLARGEMGLDPCSNLSRPGDNKTALRCLRREPWRGKRTFHDCFCRWLSNPPPPPPRRRFEEPVP